MLAFDDFEADTAIELLNNMTHYYNENPHPLPYSQSILYIDELGNEHELPPSFVEAFMLDLEEELTELAKETKLEHLYQRHLDNLIYLRF